MHVGNRRLFILVVPLKVKGSLTVASGCPVSTCGLIVFDWPAFPSCCLIDCYETSEITGHHLHGSFCRVLTTLAMVNRSKISLASCDQKHDVTTPFAEFFPPIQPDYVHITSLVLPRIRRAFNLEWASLPAYSLLHIICQYDEQQRTARWPR